MDELDELRQQRLQAEQQERAQFAKQVEQLETMVHAKMDRDALARYGALKAAHPEKAVKALVALAQLVSKGAGIDDATLKRVLIALEPQKKQMTIRRV